MKHKNTRYRFLLGALLVIVAFATGSVRFVQAAHLNGAISELSQENAASRDAQGSLEVEEQSLSATISRIQGEITAIESQISDSQAKGDEVQNKIDEAQAELTQQKKVLGENIRAMYVEDDISTLEMLATSKNLSEFVDKQQYRNSVQAKIQASLKKITALQSELKGQKEALDKLIADQRAMQARLDAQRTEQNRLLALNQSQQASYEQEIKENNAQIASLKKQQAAENAKLFGAKVPQGVPGGGGYPGKWAFAPIDSMLDSWGMYNRECVSYTAWKVWSTGRYMPYWGGRGNAKQWDDNAQQAGIPVDGNPKAGDVAISNSGTYGHSMYVEQVGDDGSIYISDYNQQFDGNYREYWIAGDTARARGLVFIHF